MKIHSIAKGLIATLAVTALLHAQKQAPPEGGKPKDFKIPQVATFTLKNGLGVTMARYGDIPKMTVRFVIRTGSIDEAQNQTLLSNLTFDYLKEGTATRTAKQIAEEAASMGGEVTSGAGADQSNVGGTVLSEFAPKFIGLLADILCHPKFPESELARLQGNYLRQIALEKAEPSSMASYAFFHVLYGEHPYGRMLPPESQVKSYDIAAVKKFYEDNFGAKRTHLYLAGVFDEKAVEKAIRENFKDWKPGKEITSNVPAPKAKRAIHIIDRPGVPQSTIMVGLPVIHPAKPDFIAFQVTDSLLGGSFASRITSNIRENKGYTYSPYSAVSTHVKDASWYELADVSTNVTGATLKEIFYEIERLEKEAPAEAELRGIQNFFAGLFVLRNSTPGGIIGQLASLRLHGLDRSYLDSYIQNVYKTTPADVSRLVRAELRAKDMVIVIAGDLQKIKDQVAPYGEIVKEEIK